MLMSTRRSMSGPGAVEPPGAMPGVATSDGRASGRLRVALLSVPPRTAAVLEFFFSNGGRGSFVVSAEADAEVAIFDLDTAASREHWDRFEAERARPGIALAVQPHQLAGTVWVQKPVTPAALLAAAAQARTMQGGVAAAIEQQPEPAPVVQPAEAATPHAESVQSGITSEPLPDAASSSESVPAPGLGVLRSDHATVTSELPVLAPAVEALVDDVADDAPVIANMDSDPVALIDAHAGLPGSDCPPAHGGSRLGAWLRRWFGGRAAEVSEPQTEAVTVESTETETTASWIEAVLPAPVATTDVLADSDPAEASRGDAVEASTEAVAAVASTPAALPESASSERPGAPPPRFSDEALWCGLHADVDGATLQSDDWRFEPALHLVSVLSEAYRVSAKWRVPALLETSAGQVLVDAPANRISTQFDEACWPALYAETLSRRPKSRTINHHELAELQAQWLAQAKVRRLDAVLWEAGALTAVGRLPDGLDLERPVYLRHWPNLTRLHQTPHALRIAALWATQGAGLLETAERLRIPQRHVFAFFAAASALDLTSEDGSHIRRVQRRSARHRGVLARLLGWLQQ